MSQPKGTDHPEVWAEWLIRMTIAGKTTPPALRVGDNGSVSLRMIRGHLAISRRTPKVAKGQPEEAGSTRTRFRAVLTHVLAVPSMYHNAMVRLNLRPAKVAPNADVPRYEGRQANLTTDDVVRWLAETGFTEDEADDAWVYARGWVMWAEEQRGGTEHAEWASVRQEMEEAMRGRRAPESDPMYPDWYYANNELKALLVLRTVNQTMVPGSKMVAVPTGSGTVSEVAAPSTSTATSSAPLTTDPQGTVPRDSNVIAFGSVEPIPLSGVHHQLIDGSLPVPGTWGEEPLPFQTTSAAGSEETRLNDEDTTMDAK